MKHFAKSFSVLLGGLVTASLLVGCTSDKPTDGIVGITENVGNEDNTGGAGSDQTVNPTIPDSKNTDRNIELSVYDVTGINRLFQGNFC